jgi:inhibitor of cysteine peptidase
MATVRLYLRLPILLAILLAIMALGACSRSQEIRIGEDESARTVELAVDEEFSVAVETNASIGWEWDITGRPDPAVASFIGRDYEAREPVQPGSGGTDLFRFLAEGVGETTITLTRTYRSEGPDREVTITIRVLEG